MIAAVLANLINNLPATLVLLAALGGTPAAGAVLAILIGVNVGPNLTYTGSLATLLWRRVLHAKGHRPVARPVHRARPADRARLPAARHGRAMGGAGGVLTGWFDRETSQRSQHLVVGGLAEVQVALVHGPERSGVSAQTTSSTSERERRAGVARRRPAPRRPAARVAAGAPRRPRPAWWSRSPARRRR